MPLTLNGTTGEVFPSWTTATRPASPVAGQTGFNTTTGQMETYNGSAWTLAVNATSQGTSGQYLQSAGAGAAPTWATVVSVPTGSVIPYAGSSAPTDWLLCSGAAVSRTTYAALFAIISTTYGAGDGSTTFNLPDMRGRLAAGVDNMGGTAANRITAAESGITGTTLGAAGGAESVTLAIADIPSHSHNPQKNSSGSISSSIRTDGSFSSGSPTSFSPATTSTGGGGSHSSTQPTMMLNYIIKT